MTIERKLATGALVAVVLTTAFAVAQVSPGQRGGTGSANPPVMGVAQGGAFSTLKLSPVQECLTDIIIWEQSNTLQKMGGISPSDYNSMPLRLKDARMEVVRACNLYHRVVLNTSQQNEYDRVILDPVNHPLPTKWETMRLKGPLAKTLFLTDEKQDEEFVQVLNRFRDRQSAIWGKGNDGGYAKNHSMLLDEFRAVLNADQAKEFDAIWKAYKKEVDAAFASAIDKP